MAMHVEARNTLIILMITKLLLCYLSVHIYLQFESKLGVAFLLC